MGLNGMWTDGLGIRNRRGGNFSSHAARQILREHRSGLQLAVSKAVEAVVRPFHRFASQRRGRLVVVVVVMQWPLATARTV